MLYCFQNSLSPLNLQYIFCFNISPFFDNFVFTTKYPNNRFEKDRSISASPLLQMSSEIQGHEVTSSMSPKWEHLTRNIKFLCLIIQDRLRSSFLVKLCYTSTSLLSNRGFLTAFIFERKRCILIKIHVKAPMTWVLFPFVPALTGWWKLLEYYLQKISELL